jgi:hypothetical protein
VGLGAARSQRTFAQRSMTFVSCDLISSLLSVGLRRSALKDLRGPRLFALFKMVIRSRLEISSRARLGGPRGQNSALEGRGVTPRKFCAKSKSMALCFGGGHMVSVSEELKAAKAAKERSTRY